MCFIVAELVELVGKWLKIRCYRWRLWIRLW